MLKKEERGFLDVMFFVLVIMVLIAAFILIARYSRAAESKNIIESGLSLQRGNVNGLENKSGLSHEAIMKDSYFKLGLDYRYNSSDNEKEGENVRLYEEYEREINGTRMFWLFDSDFEYDYVIDLERRLMGGPGVGVNIIREEWLLLKIDTGVSYCVEKYSNEVLDDKILLRGRQRFSWDITPGARLEQTFEIFPEIDNFDHYRLEGELSFLMDVFVFDKEKDEMGILKLKNSIKNIYKSHVGSGRERNDSIVSAGLCYEF